MKTTSIGIIAAALILLFAGSASAWYDGYDYRRNITLTGAASGAQTDYQVNLTIPYDSGMQANFDDLRFTKADGTTLLSAWLESKTDGVSAVVWVETDTPANLATSDIYMYYGNCSAANNWDIDGTFLFGDDFEGLEWDKDASNPIMSHGPGANDEDNYQLYDSNVIDDGGNYRMYYTANQHGPHNDQVFTATSPKSDNFKNWTKRVVGGNVTPVLTIGLAGEFDDENAYLGTVIKESASSYKMWYLGDDQNAAPWHHIRMGYATSSDGVTWTKYSTTGIYEDFTVSSHGIDYVSVWKDDATHYYAAISHYLVDRVDILQSSDGISWSPLTTNVITDIQVAELKKIGGVYYIYGVSKNDYTTIKCYTATSMAGAWTARGVQLTATGSGWEQRVFHPALVEKSAGVYVLLYSGWDGVMYPETGIATLENSVPYVTGPDATKWDDPDGTALISNGDMIVTLTVGHGIHTDTIWNRDVSFRARVKRDPVASSMFGFNDGWGVDSVCFRYDGADKLITYGGGGYTMVDGTASLSTYKTVDVHWATNKATFIVDGVEEANSPITAYVPTTATAMGFHGTDNAKVYVEWAVVRDYVETPATYTIGAEEGSPLPSPDEVISYTWNSVSGTDDNVPADYGAMVTFVADTVNATATWTFAVNGTLYQTGANNSCNVTFAEFGLHNMSVNGTGAYGVTPDHNWSVVCQREIASGSVETFPDHSEDMQDSISGEPSFEEFCKILVTPYTSVFGSIFYLFVFGTPLLMLYIRQDSLATPTTIMFLFGSMVLFMLPAQWQAIGGALMVLGLLGALFRLFKERER